MIAVHFFASIREALGVEHKTFDLPKDVETVEQLITFLAQQHGGTWSEILGKGSVMVAVNHEMAERSARLQAGDEVAFFPPVTGG
ncbi:MAG: molybdopterin converting factor subunit 1 [Gammaproteobacteria bacterium]|jgi:molybdopterin synthase sulfur carrier subunit|nr:molybdopterin converting factor subunit 1 [Gammaproteobacteria bacterium]